ncbi:hypothetical protein OBBRIDRAFT_736041 [Obba rivulosa]|uniref:Uncharacterized protein n=1 Tax=Obba rivulosa TaxID=1052685 RepID=A0A8E2AMP1_9APHY|nr:hypothetical protein OBBRIDRAFT_736041 [Obba rivulosa]
MPRSRSSNSAKASGAPVQEEQRSPVRKAEQASTPQPSSPRSPGTIFSKPLDGFGSSPARQEPFPNPSLTAAATTLMGNPSSSGNPSAIPPKPKVILSRKPRISRTKVMAKAVAQRADMSSVGSPTRVLSPRTRSSTGRKSLGVVKTGRSSNADVVKSAKLKKARQSEYIRRKSRVGGEGENVGGDDK